MNIRLIFFKLICEKKTFYKGHQYQKTKALKKQKLKALDVYLFAEKLDKLSIQLPNGRPRASTLDTSKSCDSSCHSHIPPSLPASSLTITKTLAKYTNTNSCLFCIVPVR